MSRPSRRPARERNEHPASGTPRALRVILGVAAVAMAIAAYLEEFADRLDALCALAAREARVSFLP